MKSHLLSLFNPANRLRTIIFFVAALLLITLSQIVGITDNLPGITMLFCGIVLLFFSFLHPWRKAKNYGILTGLCFGLMILVWIGIHLFVRLGLEDHISEGFVMITAFFFCLPGIFAGIIGSLYCTLRKR
jgi:hypothetical protein